MLYKLLLYRKNESALAEGIEKVIALKNKKYFINMLKIERVHHLYIVGAGLLLLYSLFELRMGQKRP